MWTTCFARVVIPFGVAQQWSRARIAQDTVKVGMVMPLTGTLADAGKQVVAGARLYVSQHGDTVAGKRIELVVKDDTSSPETGKRLIQEAIINDRIDILAGGLTAELMAAAPVITEAKKPTVIMLSSTSAVIDKSPYFVRTSCTLAQSAAILADWAAKNGIKKVVTLVSDFCARARGGGDVQGALPGSGRPDRGKHSRSAQESGFLAIPSARAGCRAAGHLRVHSLGAGREPREAVRRTRPRQGRDQTDRSGRRHRRRYAWRKRATSCWAPSPPISIPPPTRRRSTRPLSRPT